MSDIDDNDNFELTVPREKINESEVEKTCLACSSKFISSDPMERRCESCHKTILAKFSRVVATDPNKDLAINSPDKSKDLETSKGATQDDENAPIEDKCNCIWGNEECKAKGVNIRDSKFRCITCKAKISELCLMDIQKSVPELIFCQSHNIKCSCQLGKVKCKARGMNVERSMHKCAKCGALISGLCLTVEQEDKPSLVFCEAHSDDNENDNITADENKTEARHSPKNNENRNVDSGENKMSDLYDYLVSKLVSGESITYTRNGETITLKEETGKVWPNDTTISDNLCFRGQLQSDSIFENRRFYGYRLFYGITQAKKKKAWICPSLIMQIDPKTGNHFDSGSVLLLIGRTMCARGRLDAFIYKTRSAQVELIKDFKTSWCNIWYTSLDTDFDYRGLIQEQYEYFINTKRFVYEPIMRPGIPEDCRNPQKADWEILKLRTKEPAGTKAYYYKQYMSARGLKSYRTFDKNCSDDVVTFIDATFGKVKGSDKEKKSVKKTYNLKDSSSDDDETPEPSKHLMRSKTKRHNISAGSGVTASALKPAGSNFPKTRGRPKKSALMDLSTPTTIATDEYDADHILNSSIDYDSSASLVESSGDVGGTSNVACTGSTSYMSSTGNNRTNNMIMGVSSNVASTGSTSYMSSTGNNRTNNMSMGVSSNVASTGSTSYMSSTGNNRTNNMSVGVSSNGSTNITGDSSDAGIGSKMDIVPNDDAALLKMALEAIDNLRKENDILKEEISKSKCDPNKRKLDDLGNLENLNNFFDAYNQQVKDFVRSNNAISNDSWQKTIQRSEETEKAKKRLLRAELEIFALRDLTKRYEDEQRVYDRNKIVKRIFG